MWETAIILYNVSHPCYAGSPVLRSTRLQSYWTCGSLMIKWYVPVLPAKELTHNITVHQIAKELNMVIFCFLKHNRIQNQFILKKPNGKIILLSDTNSSAWTCSQWHTKHTFTYQNTVFIMPVSGNIHLVYIFLLKILHIDQVNTIDAVYLADLLIDI